MTLKLKLGKVKSASPFCSFDGDNLELNYAAWHSNGKTTLEFEVVVRETCDGKFKANVVLDDTCEAESIEKALERLAEWCQRAAEAIREPKFKKAIPT